MKGLLKKLIDKWSGVYFYRLLQKWELNGFQLQPKEEYNDFIAFHTNRLAGTLIAVFSGSMLDELYDASNELFTSKQEFSEVLDNFISRSREEPVITGTYSRDREKLKSFWMGVLTADSITDLEQGIQNVQLKSIAAAIYLSEVYFSGYYDLVNSETEYRQFLCNENNAITDFVEARVFFTGDLSLPIKYLWDRGVNLGVRVKWQDAFVSATTGNGLHLSEGFNEAVFQLIRTTTDYIAKTDFLDILTIGAKGRLISVLKKATWHDRQDDIKRNMAKKRQPEKPDLLMSRLIPINDKSLMDEDTSFNQSEYRNMLHGMAKLNQLTGREKQALVLKIAGAKEGEIPTNREVAKQMGVSEARVSQLLSDTRKKLKERYSSKHT